MAKWLERIGHVAVLAFGATANLGTAAAGDIAIVANKSFPLSSVVVEDIRDLYLGKVRELSGAGLVMPLDLPSSSNLRNEFAEKVLDKTPKELSAYWSVRIFTGHGTPPQAVHDEHAVKEWLAMHPEGIAYVDAKSVDSNMKVLLKVQ